MEGRVYGLIISAFAGKTEKSHERVSAFAGKTEKSHERVSHISRYPNTKECCAMMVY